MLRTKLAKRILNKKEQKHLTESGINSLRTFQKQVRFMAQEENSQFPCFECKHIALKLGINLTIKEDPNLGILAYI